MTQSKITKYTDGYITLITVLVILVVCTVIATSLLVFGTDWLQTSQATEEATRARNAADSCTETALALISADNAFTGTNSLTISVSPSVNCIYTVSGSAPTKTIVVSGASNTATKKLTTITSQVAPNIIISSSQVVP